MKSKLTLNIPYSWRKGCKVFLTDNEMRFITSILQDFSAKSNCTIHQQVDMQVYHKCNELILKFFGINYRHKKTIMVDGVDVPNPHYRKNEKYKKRI